MPLTALKFSARFNEVDGCRVALPDDPELPLDPHPWLGFQRAVIFSILVELTSVESFLEALITLTNALQLPLPQPLLNRIGNVVNHIALLELWSERIRKCRIKKQREEEGRGYGRHHEHAKLMQTAELTEVEQQPGRERGDGSVHESHADLLEAGLDSIDSLIVDAVDVLVAHVHYVVDGEADEDDKGERLRRADTPLAEVDRRHD